MGKAKLIFSGAVLGAAAMYVGLQYHVLLATEGFLLVPRAPQNSLGESYANVQQWDATTWAAHPRIALAVSEYGRADLLGEGTAAAVQNSLPTIPARQQMGRTNAGWEPANSHAAPGPIMDGKIARTGAVAQDREQPRRGFLPLSELFGMKSGGQAQPNAPAQPGQRESMTPVVPTGSTRKPEVEFLPPPDNVELGRPQPFPKNSNSRWRQSDANEADQAARTAAESSGWEPLSARPVDTRRL
ncbi:MAG: hypothetical protein KF861_16230 [Planctomycetaceae bacterium]|nr:hypothetical protein [Planctomycetaceae bacterium]